MAAGFADPNWVPQKITCVAWSWIGEDSVFSRVCGPLGLFGQTERRRSMLADLLYNIGQADMLTGHNLIRFDLPVINSEAMRLGLEPIKNVLVQDTMKMPKAKGFKKGQDNLGRLLKVPIEKIALDWQAWQDAYDDPEWKDVIERCATDVLQHKLIRQEMIERKWLKPPTYWRG